MNQRRWLFLFVCVLVLTACAAPATPTPPPVPTATPVPPTTTPVPPTPTAPPTATPVPPTATPKPKVNVPLVVNQSPSAAAANLESAGLKVERVEERTSSCRNIVSKQEPFTGVDVEVGTVVKIYYCVGPTPTPPPTSTPAPTATPRPTITPQFPAIPPGMGGLIVVNWYGREINYEIGGKLYKIPPTGGQVIIHLPPGKQNFSADIAGYGRAGGTIEIMPGVYRTQSWAD